MHSKFFALVAAAGLTMLLFAGTAGAVPSEDGVTAAANVDDPELNPDPPVDPGPIIGPPGAGDPPDEPVEPPIVCPHSGFDRCPPSPPIVWPLP